MEAEPHFGGRKIEPNCAICFAGKFQTGNWKLETLCLCFVFSSGEQTGAFLRSPTIWRASSRPLATNPQFGHAQPETGHRSSRTPEQFGGQLPSRASVRRSKRGVSGQHETSGSPSATISRTIRVQLRATCRAPARTLNAGRWTVCSVQCAFCCVQCGQNGTDAQEQVQVQVQVRVQSSRPFHWRHANERPLH